MRMVNAKTGDILPDKQRPTTSLFTPYSKDIANQILHLLSLGHPLSHALQTTNINDATFSNWKVHYPDFNQAIQNAREHRSDHIHEKYYEQDIHTVINSSSDELDKEDLDKRLKRQKLVQNFQKLDAPQKYNITNHNNIPHQTIQGQSGTLHIDIPPELLQALNNISTPKRDDAGTLTLPEEAYTDAQS